MKIKPWETAIFKGVSYIHILLFLLLYVYCPSQASGQNVALFQLYISLIGLHFNSSFPLVMHPLFFFLFFHPSLFILKSFFFHFTSLYLSFIYPSLLLHQLFISVSFFLYFSFIFYFLSLLLLSHHSWKFFNFLYLDVYVGSLSLV